MWAAGCIMAELYRAGVPLLRGETDVDQILIFAQHFGVPTEETWPGVSKLPDWSKLVLEPRDGIDLHRVVGGLSAEGYDLLRQLLEVDPNKRVSAAEALKHPYFDPLRTPAQGYQPDALRLPLRCIRWPARGWGPHPVAAWAADDTASKSVSENDVPPTEVRHSGPHESDYFRRPATGTRQAGANTPRAGTRYGAYNSTVVKWPPCFSESQHASPLTYHQRCAG